MNLNFLNENILKNPIVLAIIGGLLVTLYLYVDTTLIDKKEKSKIGYLRVFAVTSALFAVLLPYYHVPKRIFKEDIIPGPAPF
jgi:hypothetical protein